MSRERAWSLQSFAELSTVPPLAHLEYIQPERGEPKHATSATGPSRGPRALRALDAARQCHSPPSSSAHDVRRSAPPTTLTRRAANASPRAERPTAASGTRDPARRRARGARSTRTRPTILLRARVRVAPRAAMLRALAPRASNASRLEVSQSLAILRVGGRPANPHVCICLLGFARSIHLQYKAAFKAAREAREGAD